MGYHTARLIFTIIFFMFALSSLVSGYWLQAIFWALITMAVGYPFVRSGRVNLYYEDAPTQVVIYESGPRGSAESTAPPLYQELLKGNL